MKKIKIGLGTLVTTNQRISQAIKPSMNHLQERITSSHPALHIGVKKYKVLDFLIRKLANILVEFTQADIASITGAD